MGQVGEWVGGTHNWAAFIRFSSTRAKHLHIVAQKLQRLSHRKYKAARISKGGRGGKARNCNDQAIPTGSKLGRTTVNRRQLPRVSTASRRDGPVEPTSAVQRLAVALTVPAF